MNGLNTTNLDQDEMGHLLQLATSSNGMIELNKRNCQKLFKNGNLDVSIITLIADPDENDPGLMKCLLQHGFKISEAVDFEVENFSKEFDSSFEQLTEGDEPIKPQLITWSTPIMTNHGASNIIPLFVFCIIGKFTKSFEDPDFIALAGLALVASSSIIFVVDGELEVKAVEQIYPLPMQGLRSDQIQRYQQLQILIYDSDSLPYGNRNSSQILSEFWSRNSDISSTYYIRNLFQNIECFKLPKFINPQFKQYLTAFLDEAVDNLLLIKRSKTNQCMTGSDVLGLMKKHAEEVPDADFKSYDFIHVNPVDCSTREYRDPSNARQCLSNENQTNDEEATTSEDEDSDAEQIQEKQTRPDENVQEKAIETQQFDHLSAMLGDLTLTEQTVEQPKKPKLKFSDRFKSIIKDEMQDKKVGTIVLKEYDEELDQVNESSDPINLPHDVVSERQLHQLPPEPSELQISTQLYPLDLLKSMEVQCNNHQNHDVIVEKPTLITTRPRGKLVEVISEEIDDNQLLEKFHHFAIQVMNSKSADSSTSAYDIIKETTSELVAELPTISLDRIATCSLKAQSSVKSLIYAVRDFQDKVEGQFSEISNQEIQNLMEKTLKDFQNLAHGYDACLKLKLQELLESYENVLAQNSMIIEEAGAKAVTEMVEIFSQQIEKQFSDFEADQIQQMKQTLQEQLGDGLQHVLQLVPTNSKRLEFRQQMVTKIEDFFQSRFKEWQIQRTETDTMVKSRLDQLCSMYYAEIDAAKKTAITKGDLKESHSAITLKLLNLLEQDFSHIPKQLLEANKSLLKHRLDSLFEHESIKFVDSITSTQSASCKFASPIQTNTNSAAISSTFYYAPLQKEIKEKVSVGIHFGTSKVAMYYWDSAKGSAEVILKQSQNNLTFLDGEFHVGKDACSNGTTLEMGSMFKRFHSLELELLKPMKIKLKTESLLAVFFSRMRRIAESKLGKRIDLFVIAIPVFASVAHIKIIRFGCELIDLNCKVVYESDASAIQYFGNVGSASVLPVLSLPACVIMVLRNNSYDIAGYAEEEGKIKRTIVECKRVTGGILSWLKSWVINEYKGAYEKVAQSLSTEQRTDIKTLLMADSRNINKGVISNINTVTSVNDVQILSVCAAKGAAFWGSIHLDSKSAQDHWRKHHNSALTNPLLKKEGSVRAGHSKEREINFEPSQKYNLIDIVRKVLKFIDQDVEITKHKIRQNLCDKMNEINMSGSSTYVKGQLSNIIETQHLLLDELDVNEVYCVEVQKKIEEQIDTVLKRASK